MTFEEFKQKNQKHFDMLKEILFEKGYKVEEELTDLQARNLESIHKNVVNYFRPVQFMPQMTALDIGMRECIISQEKLDNYESKRNDCKLVGWRMSFWEVIEYRYDEKTQRSIVYLYEVNPQTKELTLAMVSASRSRTKLME